MVIMKLPLIQYQLIHHIEIQDIQIPLIVGKKNHLKKEKIDFDLLEMFGLQHH